MEEFLVGVVTLLVGVGMVFFRERYARYIINQQNRFWGFNFGEHEVKYTKILSLLFGVLVAILGVLLILHLIGFKDS